MNISTPTEEVQKIRIRFPCMRLGGAVQRWIPRMYEESTSEPRQIVGVDAFETLQYQMPTSTWAGQNNPLIEGKNRQEMPDAVFKG